MLAAPVVPIMPHVSHRRNIRQLHDDVQTQMPCAKRRCLSSGVLDCEGRLTEDYGKSVIKTLPHNIRSDLPYDIVTPPNMQDLQFSFFKSYVRPYSSEVSSSPGENATHDPEIQMQSLSMPLKATNVHNISHMSKLKVNGTVMSDCCEVENKQWSATQSCIGDSDCSASERTLILQRTLKKPTILLMKVDQPLKRKSSLSRSASPSGPEAFNVVQGGYVHRMANLNARACVAALFKTEKRSHSNLKHKNKHTQKMAVRSAATQVKHSRRKSALKDAVPKAVAVDDSKSMQDILFASNTIESVTPAVRFDEIRIEIPLTVHGLKENNDECTKVPYNILGMLYNGDTLHPGTQVFLTQSVKRELQLPNRIVPTLVPSRLSTVKRVARKAASSGMVRHDKKIAKKNNGWHPLGKPIKVMKSNYSEGVSKSFRKYYAGIKRKDEEIYVRDCVAIKAGSEEDENPYVAKVGSIWQESDGCLMMTTFWYYRPCDIETQDTMCYADRELLASQHYDINSVECIEEKCYVLGFTQYCRYRASMLRNTFSKPLNDVLCPPRKTTLTKLDDASMDNSFVELDTKKQQHEDLAPSLSELQDVDPSLVFLCYKGFNHISGKLQTGKAISATKVLTH